MKLAQLETQTMMLLDPFPPISTIRNESDAVKEKRCQYEPVFMQLADENKYETVVGINELILMIEKFFFFFLQNNKLLRTTRTSGSVSTQRLYQKLC